MEKSIANRTIVAVFPAGEDRTSLINIFSRSNWRLQFTCTLRETQTALSVSPGVVISEVQLSDGHCWSDLLDEMQKMEYEPLLPVEKKLIGWSIALGVIGLVFLIWLSHTFFPVGH